MTPTHSEGPWRVEATPRKGWPYEIRNTHRDPIAVVYSSKADAQLLGASLQMFFELQQIEADLSAREDALSAAEKDTLNRIRALIAEVTA